MPNDPPEDPRPVGALLKMLGRVALKAGVQAAESGLDSVLDDAEGVIDTGARTVRAIRDGIRARRDRR